MKKILLGATLLALLTPAASAQTSTSEPVVKPLLPPGFANAPETKWGGDLPPGLSNDLSKRDWENSTPPGWSNQHSQGWQNGGGPSSMGGGSSSMGGGSSSMAGGRGKGR
jgi:hypothetical protein